LSSGDYIHVVAAIVWQPECRHRLLISKRQKGKHLQDYWELPGGKLEPGESPRQALDRELREEINIVSVNASRYKQVNHNYDDLNILLDVWEVTSFKRTPMALEGQIIKWVAVDQLAKYRFPAADRPILETIVNNATVKMEYLP